MKRFLLLFLLSLCAATSQAESPETAPSITQDKTLKAIAPRLILAMDRILPGATEDKIKAKLPEETRAILDLYLAGHIRQWYFREDRPGAVFLLEATSQEDAQAMLDDLPLSKAGLLAYDLIPLGPYIPLATLRGPEANKSPKKKTPWLA